MIVKVVCPIAGCGTQVQVQSLPKHLENIHELDGELVLRLHPTSPYQVIEPETLTEAAEQEQEAEKEKEQQEPETEKETEPGEE